MRSRNNYRKEKKAERAERTTANVKAICTKMDQVEKQSFTRQSPIDLICSYKRISFPEYLLYNLKPSN
jgi:hypothetical protein